MVGIGWVEDNPLSIISDKHHRRTVTQSPLITPSHQRYKRWNGTRSYLRIRTSIYSIIDCYLFVVESVQDILANAYRVSTPQITRPFGAVDVSLDLKGAVSKTGTQRVLLALAERGGVTQNRTVSTLPAYGYSAAYIHLFLGKSTFFV